MSYPQCALAGKYQKYTTLMYTPELDGALVVLADLRCTCVKHAKVARGWERRGHGWFRSWKSATAAAYPEEMNRLILNAFESAMKDAAQRREGRQAAPARDAPMEGDTAGWDSAVVDEAEEWMLSAQQEDEWAAEEEIERQIHGHGEAGESEVQCTVRTEAAGEERALGLAPRQPSAAEGHNPGPVVERLVVAVRQQRLRLP